MISLEDLVEDLKSLTPEQLQQVANVVHGFSLSGGQPSASESQGEIPQSIIDKAILHGWPQELFTELIGSLPELERPSQPPYNIREPL